MIRLTGLVEMKPLTTEEKWIKKAIKKPGALHKQLGVPEGEKIPTKKLTKAAKKGGKLGKRARLAQTLGKLKNENIQHQSIEEGGNEDHEVSMAQSTLDSIIRHASELKDKLGEDEKNIPAWIQDHITNAENYIDQANTSYHEYGDEEEETDMTPDKDLEQMAESVEPLEEKAPEGWEATVLRMKKHKEIDNPWALAHWMKSKGYHPHKKSVKKLTKKKS